MSNNERLLMRLTRRNLLRAAGLLTTGGQRVSARQKDAADTGQRSDAAMKLRQDVAVVQHNAAIAPQIANGDESSFPRYTTAFTKGLPHDQNGEVDGAAYQTVLRGI